MTNPFKKPKTPAPPPAPKTPATMPVADDMAIKLEQRKNAAERATRSGRVSTILSQGADSGTLGG